MNNNPDWDKSESKFDIKSIKATPDAIGHFGNVYLS